MKFVAYVKWFLMICFLTLPVASGAEAKADENLSYAVPEMHFTFQPVVEGTEVVHDFVILNKGTDVLSVLNVKTG
jgi:hypothetical protein